ncbi:hypothetical protein V6Z96_008511 [Aspergillus fumigatus]
MSKRSLDSSNTDHRQPKRPRITRVDNQDRLSLLSDELLLQILSFLPIPSLLICQRVSRRFHALAGDSELWKRQYYSRWVRPRARRVANIRHATLCASKATYSPHVSTWLGHSHLAEGKVTNWKRQYRLRHNWSKGICQVTEVELPQPPHSPMLIRFCAGFVFTADCEHGLRCWRASHQISCTARLPLVQSELETSAFPTALAVSRCLAQNLIKVTVGFADGRFGVYDMDTKSLYLRLRSSNAASADGAITAMAISNSYLLMVSEHKVLSLYEMFLAEPEHSTRSNAANTSKQSAAEDVKLLESLKADSILSPMSLSIRLAHSKIIASIVYSFFHIGCGWSLGIQELHFGKNGEQIGSRLATTVNAQYGAMPLHHLTRSRRGYSSSFQTEPSSGESLVELTEPSILHQEPPTSISYSHPYLLTSHADNTLTVYLVVSTGAKLFIKGGQRLWGHTSSVSAVQVSDHGKAISVSSRGDEIRVWELESLIPSLGSSKEARVENSIQVNPENKLCKIHGGGAPLALFLACQHCGPQLASGQMSREYARMGDCVGFDDERLLLSSRKETGAHLIAMYDFT